MATEFETAKDCSSRQSFSALFGGVDLMRVCCLYRVSTKAQAYDDLYTQKYECRKFAEKNHWEIVREIQVQGKSGRLDFEHRNDLQEIFELAKTKAFDILLVFMFDRIGRRNDETSVFTLVLDQLGIQIWSVQEGRLDFSNHVEKLRNYINYWHAENESINLSHRVKTKMNQLAAEGHYRGGNIPFGYKLAWYGRANRAKQPIHDLEINPVKAEVVRKIFDLYLNDDFGTFKIADYLNQHGILSNTGKAWYPDRIHYLLKNRTYMGIIRNGQTESDIIPSLQIITPERFAQVQEKMAGKSQATPQLRVSDTYQPLFAGKVRCGNCGEVMHIRHTAARYTAKTGDQQLYRDKAYICKSQSKCKPKSTNAKKVDQSIIELASAQIMRLIEKQIRQIKTPEHNQRLACLNTRLSATSSEHTNMQMKLLGLEAEISEGIAAHVFKGLDLLAEQKEKLHSQISYKERELDALRQKYSEVQKERELFRNRVRRLMEQLMLFDTFNTDKQLDFIHTIIAAVNAHGKDSVQIIWSKEFQYILDFE